MVQINRPVRDPAKQVEPEVASLFRQSGVDFNGCRFEAIVREGWALAKAALAGSPVEIVTARHNDYTGSGKI
jgi:hypothetical protein